MQRRRDVCLIKLPSKISHSISPNLPFFLPLIFPLSLSILLFHSPESTDLPVIFYHALFLLFHEVFVLLFFPKQLPYCYLVISNVLVNFIPIVKSDGYYAVVTLFNKTNIKKDKVATTLEDAIRGIIMFGVLGIFSWLSQ